MAQELLTFKDVVDAIGEAIGVQRDDTNARNKIKRFVNMYYLDEVVPFKRWTWLQKTTSVVHKAYYNTGTALVTPESTDVTLSVAPNSNLGSFKNQKFSVDGSNKVYTISAHTAGSASVTLSGAYQESLDTDANFKIWRDVANLPTDAKETIEIWHAERSKPVTGVGPQGLRKLEAADPKAEGFPSSYSTTDFFDPSDDDDETESDRYRQIRLYPSITSTPVTINIDYVPEINPMEDDTDEPLMPISDRIVLVYGAGAMAWSIIGRNEEMHDRWQIKADQKLARMAGDRDEGYDTPTLSPKSGYLNTIRKSGLKRRTVGIAASSGSQSSVSLPSYLSDVRINGATLIDDMDVDAGVLIDGRDVSEDGEVLDNLVGSQQVTIVDGTAGDTLIALALASYDVAHVRYSIKRGTSREAGIITMVSDGSTVAFAVGAGALIGDCGVTLNADISGSNMRLTATATSTGTNATFTYQVSNWLS